MENKGEISRFIEEHFKHFNAAALVDAARGYEEQLKKGNKMMVTLAGAMSSAELGKSLAEMIRQDKIDIISCTGANLEEDLMNLVAHSHYRRVPGYRDLTPEQEWELLEKGLNRVTDTCIPEEEAFRRLQKHIFEIWKGAEAAGERYLPHEYMYKLIRRTAGCWPQLRKTFLSWSRDGRIRPWGTSLPLTASRGSLRRKQ